MLPTVMMLIGLIGVEDRTTPVWVAVDQAELLVAPDDASATTHRLAKGQRLDVVDEGPDGWLAVLPPPGSFSWIDRDAITIEPDGKARVIEQRAAVRPGVEGGLMPAGVWTIVPRGIELELMDLAPLVLRQADGTRRIFYAVRPPRGELRYLRVEEVSRVDPRALGREGDASEFGTVLPSVRGRRRLASGSGRRVPAVDPDFVAVGPPVREVGLARWFDEELGRVESRHRAALAGRLESWSLEPVRRAYEELATRASGPIEREAIALRLRQLERQQAAAQAARRLRELAASTQQRDAELDSLRRQLGKLATGAESPFEAEGLLQRCSELVDGRRAFLLIGDDGLSTIYLVAPPGLDLDSYVAARVGVRGDSRFHSVLKSRVITVRDIERLDDPP
ncbi:MAG: hypothetical protein KatS3mg108_2002 [Isosphaeraceae bacterium]|jgi:hypothetical protein|nr:MAG: hypothetical protein KatS3mg108_2002 [Isosphaeraceae bacterium]